MKYVGYRTNQLPNVWNPMTTNYSVIFNANVANHKPTETTTNRKENNMPVTSVMNDSKVILNFFAVATTHDQRTGVKRHTKMGSNRVVTISHDHTTNEHGVHSCQVTKNSDRYRGTLASKTEISNRVSNSLNYSVHVERTAINTKIRVTKKTNGT